MKFEKNNKTSSTHDSELISIRQNPPTGIRLDAWLSQAVPDHSRSRWQKLIRERHVLVDGTARKPGYELSGDEEVTYRIPPATKTSVDAEAIPLSILFEDEDILVINKAAGMVVHPAPGHSSGTLVHAILHHCPNLQGIGGEERPGIVHRLDKDTSGVLITAKNEQAMNSLMQQFKEHTVKKHYHALVWGNPQPLSGKIETTIGRHPVDRKKMSIHARHGRPALSFYRCLQTFENAAEIEVCIETGRTHQIRVHMASIGHAVIGDAVYGKAPKKSREAGAQRQMLHAHQLEIDHPSSGKRHCFTAPLPSDYISVREFLESNHLHLT